MSNPPSQAAQERSAANHFESLLKQAITAEASDIHIRAGQAPRIRRHGSIKTLPGWAPLSASDTASIAARILYQARVRDKEAVLKKVRDLLDEDCSYAFSGGRFRVNICRQQGTLDLVMRVVPETPPNLQDLGLPETLADISMEERGLVLVTGVTGSGKSTSLAAMIHHINQHAEKKIITIEDPIEYLHRDIRSAITQREVGSDTESFNKALRAALRQDPDVIMVGEMRDRETIDIAMKAAETGHLVFSTLHTSDVEKTVTRIVSMFERDEQAVARLRLADSLKAAISQRLLPRKDSRGRVAAMEIMRVTLSVKSCIEDPSKGGMLELVGKGAQYGMQTFDQHLTQLYQEGIIRLETAKAAATSPNDFERNLSFT
ncbi:MAG TPA: PilT/PilU family type 4a pilus ATPase [Acidobacteriota bacterium]|nr:PilT/PilU family type 4a pilus ATPase [Acidobacteriota bacterium]